MQDQKIAHARTEALAPEGLSTGDPTQRDAASWNTAAVAASWNNAAVAASWKDAAVAAGLRRALPQRLQAELSGRLRLVLPSGRQVSLGGHGREGADATLVLASYGVVWRALRRGTLGFAESYLGGDIDSPDMADVFRFFCANHAVLARAGRGAFRTRLPDRIAHWRRDNSRAGSRRNIAFHYDLGNDFYRLWLDPGMTYSSALYETDTASLEAAQRAKHALIVEALEIEPGARVLEIGCGWGSMAEAVARSGGHVTGITVSREQEAYARERLAAAGFADRAEIRFEDYRDTGGTFDRIVSVEMIEAVGEAHWPQYFATLRDRLVPGGSAVLQAITIAEANYAAYRRTPDFIQRYIFPGGMLPTTDIMMREAARAGLAFETVKTFGQGYARTLADWRTRFMEAWPRIAAQGFDERFRRMWDYYLTYCEVGFETGNIDVGVYRLRRMA